METNRIVNLALIAALTSLLVVIGLYATYFYQIPIAENGSAWGQFGDYIGGVLNPIFGFLGLIALLYTLKQNEKALNLSASELALTRDELKKSAAALDGQKQILDIQTFEQSYFNFLNLLNERIESFKNDKYSGRTAMSKTLNSLLDFINSKMGENFYTIDSGEYDRLYASFISRAGIKPYYILIYNLLKYIDESQMTNKSFYTKILRAQLSTQELLLIFYHSISVFGRNDFLILVKKYNLLKHLEREKIRNRELFFDQWFEHMDFDATQETHKI